jgi:long-chain acyl-CoA synthetase
VPFLSDFAQSTPDKPAVISAATGEQVSYAELEDRSIRFANLLRASGLVTGDVFAVLAENHVRYFELFWAAMRAGYYVTFINRHLTGEEIAYQVTDSEAKVFVATRALADQAQSAAGLIDPAVSKLMIDGIAPGFASYEEALAGASPVRPERQPRGDGLVYSSGTTGRPKGIKRPLRDIEVDDPSESATMLHLTPGVDASMVYLNPAPLYHAAAIFWTTPVHRLGGTVVIMPKFDPAEFLSLIGRYGVTHTQVVPTMMIRVLKLPAADRLSYDVSSLRALVHAAAPCPVEVKQQMMDWLGPVIYEYYGGTEGHGITFITPQEWLAHPGSVGQPIIGIPHICDELGRELLAGQTGEIYFEQPKAPFEYHGDAEKTRKSRHPEHPTGPTIGDIGRLDEDGYLYLTDRANFMIISGGVNIYPTEIENCLILLDQVADVAVIGLPDPEMGEFVQAIVQLAPGVEPGAQTEAELRAFARQHLAGYKVPKRFDFRAELPRMETGKLAKNDLRREYLAAAAPSD